ncbi:MAG: hypothetical protein JWQ09_1026, partial [Segetibacter sp.]|nr:hypothetical protein [Segetibacter sp.]
MFYILPINMLVLPRINRVTGFISKQNKGAYVILSLLIATGIALQQYTNHSYNNYIIFTSSFNHLLAGQNLYSFYPSEYYDLFLYNPTFTILFAPFHFLPVWLGMITWTIINMLVFGFAINKLPFSNQVKAAITLLCLPDLINSLQHMQVNTISISFIILTYVSLKEGRPFIAAFLTVFVLFIKVYPAACGLFFLFFPGKLKYLTGVFVFGLLMFALPLLVVSPHELMQQYQNWFGSLQRDRTITEDLKSMSLISINYRLLSNPVNPALIQLAGLLATLLPLTQIKKLKDSRWQVNYIAAICLFIIVFNHAAEPATYLIAVAGIA